MSKSKSTGYRIQKQRKKLGMRLVDLSKKSGISISNISNLENDASTLGIKRAKVLSKPLKVKPSYLLFGEK